MILTRRADALELLRHSPTIAVLGASSRPERPGYYVPAYLHEQGYKIIPVNPGLAGQILHGSLAVATLDEAGPVDLINVFRRPELRPAHQEALVAARPRGVWFQLGIRHDVVARSLAAEGIAVVQDLCTLAEHRGVDAVLGQPRADPAVARGVLDDAAVAQGGRRALDRLDDLLVARAPADVEAQLALDRLARRLGIVLEQAGRPHDDARDAEGALRAAALGEALGEDAAHAVVETLERADTRAARLLHRRRCRLTPLTLPCLHPLRLDHSNLLKIPLPFLQFLNP